MNDEITNGGTYSPVLPQSTIYSNYKPMARSRHAAKISNTGKYDIINSAPPIATINLKSERIYLYMNYCVYKSSMNMNLLLEN
jgi:hypothetical protein